MIKYLIIQLDDTSVSYCHYPNAGVPRLISLDDLRVGILWAMKENATVQFVYPAYRLPDGYSDLIESIDHAKVVPAQCEDVSLIEVADVVVFDGLDGIDGYIFRKDAAYVVRVGKDKLMDNAGTVGGLLSKASRLNVVITDIDRFTDADFEKYKVFLAGLSDMVKELYLNGNAVQLNLLTDRMMLDRMNNCNAGWETIALAPNGRFYICPAFYGDGSEAVGDLHGGLDIKNPQLYRLDHAPICRKCDAWQCRRCVWLNRCFTFEINTPSYEQCVVSHLERNASRQLLLKLQSAGLQLPQSEIPEVAYIDPFEIVKKRY